MKTIFTFVSLLFGINISWCNNIQVSNVSLTGQNTVDDFTIVEFDISWENSWRIVGGSNNWDAAWIFVKYRSGSGPWLHAWLNNTGHTNCSGTTISNGLLNPNLAFDPSTNPALGVFLYRSSPGNGTISCSNVQLRWNYGLNGISDDQPVDIKVFAIEHVYVLEGSFYVGNGPEFPPPGAFYTYPSPDVPFQITSEAAITVGTNPGDLYYEDLGGDQTGPVPALFPKGYNDFYVMKYEISQQGYVDFLNTLNRAQQINRVRSNINFTTPSTQFVMVNDTAPINRNGIWVSKSLPLYTSPVNFQCNLNDNEIGGEQSDGQNVANNNMEWGDLGAYLDWAALRPMTELEYEKGARGPLPPVPHEYAWGNTFIFPADGITNAGMPDELPSNDTPGNLPNCTATQNNNQTSIYRCGVFARMGTDRTHSGATYYGALDFSGNAKERAICAGTSSGRTYQGHHGNGLLNSTGNADVQKWPNPLTESGVIDRGGGWSTTYDTFQDLEISFRVNSVNYPSIDVGGRGVRTAP